MRVAVNEVSSQIKFHIFLFIYLRDSAITTSHFVNTARNLHLLIFLTFLRIDSVRHFINYHRERNLGAYLKKQ